MKRRHLFGGLGMAFLIVAVLRLLIGNGFLWHFLG